MNSIILHLLTIIQYQYRQICWLILFIAKYIPLKQWAFDDSHSPKYQKFKTDILPNVIYYEEVEYQWLIKSSTDMITSMVLTTTLHFGLPTTTSLYSSLLKDTIFEIEYFAFSLLA